MYSLGIDISKDSFTVSLLKPQATLQEASRPQNFPNDEQGYEQLLDWLNQQHVPQAEVHAVLEATGVYWEGCAYYLHAQGLKLSVMNPTQVKRFAQSLLRRGKTDGMDAQLLALFVQRMQPAPWQPAAEALELLKLMVREREAITLSLTQEKNRREALRLRAVGSATLERLTQERIRLLEKQRKELEKELKAQLARAGQAENAALLQSLPGVGTVTAASLLAETAAFAGFENAKQLVAYAGIAPSPQQSGRYEGHSGISKIGNKRLRRTVYLAALTAVRCEGCFRELYQRLLRKGKAKKLALVAVARKVLTVALAVVKSKRPFDPHYHATRPCEARA